MPFMDTQYDYIANTYHSNKSRIFYKIVDHSLKKMLGNLSNLKVLDLACGEGHITRQLKSYGAKNVIGVDISKEMIKLAEKQEKSKRLGIKYICSSVQELGRLDTFDIITGVYLLHYARKKEELKKICTTISENLKIGGCFIGVNTNGIKSRLYDKFTNYDFEYVLPKNIRTGQMFKTVVHYCQKPIELQMYYYSQKTYNSILRESGFRKVDWIDFDIPPELDNNKEVSHWKRFIKLSAEGLLHCRK